MSTLDAQSACSAGEIPTTVKRVPRVQPVAVQRDSKEALYARAARQMRLGKWIVIGGFGLLLVGVVTYCLASMSGSTVQEPGRLAGAGVAWISLAAQAAMASGMVAWLLGCFLHMWGALDSDPDGPDLYF